MRHRPLERRFADWMVSLDLVPTIWTIGAALAEIAGRFSFWAWRRLDQPIWWVIPGMASLAAFAYLLSLVDSDATGRAYAAYGGVYIVPCIAWLWVVEGRHPDQWDILGGTVCLLGAVIILHGAVRRWV